MTTPNSGERDHGLFKSMTPEQVADARAAETNSGGREVSDPICQVCLRPKWHKNIKTDPNESCDYATQASWMESDPEGAKCFERGYERLAAMVCLEPSFVQRIIAALENAIKTAATAGYADQPDRAIVAELRSHLAITDQRKVQRERSDQQHNEGAASTRSPGHRPDDGGTGS